MSEGTQRRLAAIVSADVAGYSRLISADEEGTLAALRAHRAELIDPLIAEHGGRIVKTMGDGLLLEFPSVVNATRCAIEVQRGMAARNAEVPRNRQVVFRIGVNLGDIVIDGDDILGDGVNIAARLQALAEPGGVSVSRRVHEDVQDRLNERFVDTGEHVLKNITRPVQVWRWAPRESDGSAQMRAEVLPLTLPNKPSIVVLPFANLSGDPSQDYFVDGLVEDFTVALGREKWLFVIASPSAFSLRDDATDPRRVAAELGVHYVLRGSMRRDADHVRIVVRLSDGQSGGLIWSDRFEDQIDNVFAMQDRLMTQVVAAIAPALQTSEIERAHRKPTHSLSAFDLYLQALPRYRTGLVDNRQALGLLDRAIALDPSYSTAYGLAARCYQFQKIMGWVPPTDPPLTKGVQLAQRASQIGTNDAEALWMAGLALTMLDGELDQGTAMIERSLSLNPSSANAWTSSSLVHSYSGEYEVAIDHFRKAQRLNPIDQSHHIHWNIVGLAYFGSGRYVEADEAADKTLNALPTYLPGLRLKVATCGLFGRTEESGRYLQRLLTVQPDCCVTWLAEILRPMLRRNPDCFAKYIEGVRLAGLPERPSRPA